MAELFVSPIATTILEMLSSLSGEAISSFGSLGDELQKLEQTISRINAVLCDAGKKSNLSELEKVTVMQLKYVLYDAEDLLEYVYFKAQLQHPTVGCSVTKPVRNFFKNSMLAFGVNIAGQVANLRENLDTIGRDLTAFKFEPSNKRQLHLAERKQTCSLVYEDHVIGRDGDRDAVIKLLLDSDTENDVSFLSIVGIGGLGKTTLAQVVFNDPIVQSHFEKRVWVCISDEFYVNNVVQKVIESANGEKKLEGDNMEALQKKMKELLEGKQYLIVLDDVWNEKLEKWQMLKALLTCGAKGSKILITTRSKRVADVAGVDHSHDLEGLSFEDSFCLFEKIAFKQRKEFENPELVEVAKKIIEKCVGVPLAIKTIGALLYTKPPIEWQQFECREFSSIALIENDIMPILKLSYDNLPHYLKQCFAYCSLFLKDAIIKRETLIQLWIAQGFIPLSSENQFLEDTGNDYFRYFLWTSIFQQPKEDKWGNIESVKMHDLMHDLAISVSKSEHVLANERLSNILVSSRHVSFHCEFEFQRESSPALCKAKKIRTFLSTDSLRFADLRLGYDDEIISTFRHLRALSLSAMHLKAMPRSIGELIHLRYLDLSHNILKSLPNSITRLLYLHTLNLSYNFHLEKLPTDLKKLRNMRHIYLEDCFGLTCMPRGIGQMTNLQTLSRYVVGKKFTNRAEIKELKDLHNLKGSLLINIDKRREVVHWPEILSNKKFVQSLVIYFGPLIEADVSNKIGNDKLVMEGLQLLYLKELSLNKYRGQRPAQDTINQSILQFPKLVRLCLWDCTYLPNFGHHPNLKSIYLEDLPDVTSLSLIIPKLNELHSLEILILHSLNKVECIQDEYVHSSQRLYLPALKTLSLRYMPNLKGWWKQLNIGCGYNTENTITTPHFPQLSHLSISKCPNLIAMPFFPYLEKLELRNINSKLLLEQQHEQMMKWVMETSTSTSTPFSPFSDLRFLEIESVDDIPDGLLKSFTSLKSIQINKDSEINCTLPEKLLAVNNTLQFLQVIILNVLPDWIADFNSLRRIAIFDGSNMESLPQGLAKVTSLKELVIEKCPKLVERCRKHEGADWDKISHIPSVEINGKTVNI